MITNTSPTLHFSERIRLQEAPSYKPNREDGTFVYSDSSARVFDGDILLLSLGGGHDVFECRVADSELSKLMPILGSDTPVAYVPPEPGSDVFELLTENDIPEHLRN